MSHEFSLQHRIRMWRKSIAELAPVGVGGTRDSLNLRHAEIVLGFDVGAVDFGYLDRAGELFILRLEFDLDGLIAVAVDHVQNDRAVVVTRGHVQVRRWAESLALVFRA